MEYGRAPTWVRCQGSVLWAPLCAVTDGNHGVPTKLMALFLEATCFCVQLPIYCLIFILSERQRQGLPSASSVPIFPQQPGLGQAKARSPERSPSLPRGWHGPLYLSRHLLPPGDALAGTWIRSGVAGTQASIPSSDLTAVPDTCPTCQSSPGSCKVSRAGQPLEWTPCSQSPLGIASRTGSAADGARVFTQRSAVCSCPHPADEGAV